MHPLPGPAVRLAIPLTILAFLPALLSGQDAAPPLASFASARLIVLPVQAARMGEMTEWGRTLGGPRGMTAAMDGALANALAERRLDANWVLPEALAQTARRNPTYVTDPSVIRAGDAVRVLERQKKGSLAEPVASQLRALVGLHDARHALVAVELRFEPMPGGGAGATGSGRALLHVAIIDVRAAQIVWRGDIVSDGASTPAATLLQLAERFVDLVVPR